MLRSSCSCAVAAVLAGPSSALQVGVDQQKPWLLTPSSGLKELFSQAPWLAPRSGEVSNESLLLPDNSTSSPEDRSAAEAQRLNFVKINAQGDITNLRYSLIVSVSVTVGFLFSFSVLRRAFPTAYLREEPEEVLGTLDTASNWLSWVWRTTPEQEVKAAGLDAWSVLEFFRLGGRITGFLGFFLLSVLCPIHWVKSSHSLDPLSRLDVGSLPAESHLIWVHAVSVWFVVLVCNSFILQAHHNFLARRFEWLKAIPVPRANTLLLENIPEAYRSDDALRNYFVGLFREEAIESAYIVRKTPKLRQKQEWFTTVKYLHVLAETNWRQSGEGDEGKAEVDEKVRQREEALAEVAAEMARVEKAVILQDPNVVSPAGFVTFTSQFWQHLASREQYRADVDEFIAAAPPDPQDVLWQDLAQGHLGSRLIELLGWTCLGLIFLFWSPVVVFISSLTTLNNLARVLPALQQLCTKFPALQTLIEGFLATAALKLFLSFLPNILMSVIRRFFTLKAGTLAQLQLQRWYYSFLIVFVLLVTLVGRSFMLTVTELAHNPMTIVDRLAASLPSASHFYLNYVLLGWFTLAFELLRFFVVVRYAFLRFFYWLEPQKAKEYSEPEDQDAYGVGSRMGMAGLMFSISLVFSVCSPLILVFAFVYFWIGRYTYGYLLMFGESRKPDLGGRVFFEAERQIIIVVGIFVLLMTGVLLRHSGAAEGLSFRSPPGPPLLAGLALLAVYYAWRRLHSLTWDSLPLEEVVATCRALEAAPAPPGRPARYVQRECDLQLLLEDAEKVATARASSHGGLTLAVQEYVRTAADLYDLGSQLSLRGTETAALVMDRGLGAVDDTVQAMVDYSSRGAEVLVDGSSQAADAWLSRVRQLTQAVRGQTTTRMARSVSGGTAEDSSPAAPPPPPPPPLPPPPVAPAESKPLRRAVERWFGWP